jgi:serine O-acetyltransferase
LKYINLPSTGKVLEPRGREAPLVGIRGKERRHFALMNDQPNNAEHTVSADIPDWSREKPQRFWDPGRKLLLSIRRYQYWRDRSGLVAHFIGKFFALRYIFWCTVTGAEIPLNCHIGGGLLIPHPNGIVIHPGVKIGVNCLIFQQVTIGTRGPLEIVPVIEGHVDIGAGAKILGPVHIGAHVRVGANAVVLRDVPCGTDAVGIPARIIVQPAASNEKLRS